MRNIEKGVPIPPYQHGPQTTEFSRTVKEMAVGDSFFEQVPPDEMNAFRARCSQYWGRHKIRLTVRVVEGGVRVWRTE